MVMLHFKLKGMTHAATWKQIVGCRPPPPDPRGWGEKFKLKLFQDMVMVHIKLKSMTNAATCTHIICTFMHPRPLGLDQRSTTFFLKVVIFHIKLIGIEHRAPCNHILCPCTHPQVGSGQTIFFTESSHVAYQNKGNGA